MKNFFVYLAIISLGGCATVTHMNELLTLKGVANSQADIDNYLKKQEKGFNRLRDDIKNNRLNKGKLERAVIAQYYEPILVKKSDTAGIKDVFLYRHPTNYFDSDRIYLYFDTRGKLSSWELKPAGQQEKP